MPFGLTGLDPNLLPPAGNATSARLDIASARKNGSASRAQAVSGVAPTPATAPAEPRYRGILSAGPVTPPPAVAELVRSESATRAERPAAPRSTASSPAESAYQAAPASAATATSSFRNSVPSRPPLEPAGVDVTASSRPSTVRRAATDSQRAQSLSQVQAATAYSAASATRPLQAAASRARTVTDGAPNAAAQAADRDRVAIG